MLLPITAGSFTAAETADVQQATAQPNTSHRTNLLQRIAVAPFTQRDDSNLARRRSKEPAGRWHNYQPPLAQPQVPPLPDFCKRAEGDGISFSASHVFARAASPPKTGAVSAP
jgi:hypothetical protein